MNARTRLETSLAAAMRTVASGQSEQVPALDLPTLVADIPGMGGRCELVPHSPETPPLDEVALSYVRVRGGGDALRCAFWMGGEWKGRNLKPLKGEVEVWYHVKGAEDGA